MSSPLSLNKARKDRDRSARKSQADENAVKFGQSKSQKEALKARAQLIARNLEGHKRET
ncbi:hypothetical protein GGR95_001611 [Sulfitobacter undariae]|uniref:DUF4169 domain-containing protein n=1 Tax=Sulfitobacter undariae TaxID=1563671 RepID=A0A7W6GZW5_9RHOB|nr:DUF4169 family protein [Sulfitobacter undariae]MBB3993980.1 hypothetical protein [Sulfitobacter undariae]